MTLELQTFELPAHWASPLINGDISGLSIKECRQLDAFEAKMLKKYGSCHAVDCSDEPYFMKYHDASMFGVLACDVLEFTFDVTGQEEQGMYCTHYNPESDQ